MSEANNITAFIEERLVINPTAMISKNDLFEAYIDFCSKNDFVHEEKNVFDGELRKLIGSKIRTMRVGIGNRRYYWGGIKLKPERL